MINPASDSRSRMRLSVKWRLTLWYGGSILVLFLLFSSIAITAFHWNRHAILHQRLFGVQSELLPDVHIDAEGAPYLVPRLQERDGTLQLSEPLGTFARLVSTDGKILDQSSNWRERAGFTPMVPQKTGFSEIQTVWNDHPVRAAYAPIQHHGAVVGWLEVSGLSWQAHEPVVGWHLHVAVAGTLVLALLGGFVLSRQAMKPVIRLTDAAQTLSATNLGVRLPVKGFFEDELTDLTAVFNAMLARLETAFEREKRFTANAAHELMNPLASIRSQAEITLRRARVPQHYETTLQTILEEVQRLSISTEHLLHLARLEEAAGEDGEPLHITALLNDRLTHWHAQAATSGHTLITHIASDQWIRIHATHLTLILDNLLDNAIKYTPVGGTISVTLTNEADTIQLSVSDTGFGFDETTRHHIFDRFFRAPTDDVQQQPGAGLGLAVVHAVVAAYNGHIKASSAGPNQGSTFGISFEGLKV